MAKKKKYRNRSFIVFEAFISSIVESITLISRLLILFFIRYLVRLRLLQFGEIFWDFGMSNDYHNIIGGRRVRVE
jgi:hypothetical protein